MRQPIVRWNRSTRPNPIDVTRPMIGRLNVPSDKFCEYFTSETGRDCSRSTYGMLIAAHGCMTVLQLTSWRWTQSGDEQNVAAVVVMIARVIYWLYRVVFGRYLRTVAITTAPAAAALSGLTASANTTTCLHRRSTQWSAHYKFTKRRKSRWFSQTKQTFPRKCTGTVHTVYYCDMSVVSWARTLSRQMVLIEFHIEPRDFTWNARVQSHPISRKRCFIVTGLD